MNAAAILNKLDSLGISAWVAGEQVRLKPFSKVPADLLDELKAHKQEVILKLSERPKHSEAEVAGRLQGALKRKEKEIASDKSYLFSIYCARPELTEQRTAYLEAHVVDIKRYLEEGGTLKLPRCYRQHGWTCLLAMRGFDECAMLIECGFSLRL